MEIKKLNDKGLTGIIAFWMIIFNFALPLCTAAFSLYWVILLSDKVWIQSVGLSLFISNIFTLILSLASFAFNILSILKIKIIFEQLAYQIFIVTVIVTFAVCCISLSLSSYRSADRAYQDIVDYCLNHQGNKYSIQFFVKYSTFISQKNYILRRTVEANSILSGIFGVWLGSFIIYIICFIILKDRDDGQLLLNDNNVEYSSRLTFALNQETEPANEPEADAN